MKIGVISDIHDNIWKLEAVLKELKGMDMLLCLGDMCSPFTLKQIAEGIPGAVHVVFGNNDGDKWLITTVAVRAGNVTLHDGLVELEVGGKRIAGVHFPELGRRIAEGGRFAAVFYGHDHKRFAERTATGWLVNPGEVMGRFGASTYAVYDTESDLVEIHEIR